MRVNRIWRMVGREIFVIGVGCANRHFILRRICGKSPVGANADWRLVAGWLGVNCLVVRESKGVALDGWLGVASDFVGAVALRCRGKHAQGVFGGDMV